MRVFTCRETREEQSCSRSSRSWTTSRGGAREPAAQAEPRPAERSPAPRRSPENVFGWDGDQIVVAHDAAGSALWEATWGPETDQLLEWRDAATGNAYLPLRDNRNSPLSLWGTTEDRIVATAEHTPEGRLTVRDAAGSPTCQEPSAAAPCRLQPGLPFAFASAWRSAASGLVYLRNRWCSPELGEFLGPDPSPFSDSYDSYAYAGGDPINAADPFGTKASYVTSVSGTPGKDPKNAIEDKWLSSRPEYFDPHLTSPRERMQMDQWQRELQAQADAETVRNSMSWFETVIFELSWFTGGNKMAIGWTGENQWGNQVSTFERVTTGVSGVVDAASIATTTTGLAKTVIVEARGQAIARQIFSSDLPASAWPAAPHRARAFVMQEGKVVEDFMIRSGQGPAAGQLDRGAVVDDGAARACAARARTAAGSDQRCLRTAEPVMLPLVTRRDGLQERTWRLDVVRDAVAVQGRIV